MNEIPVDLLKTQGLMRLYRRATGKRTYIELNAVANVTVDFDSWDSSKEAKMNL